MWHLTRKWFDLFSPDLHTGTHLHHGLLQMRPINLLTHKSTKDSKCGLVPLSYATHQEAPCGKYGNLSKYLDVSVYVTPVYHYIIFLKGPRK